MNVKKGDTAIVINSDYPENIGIICEVRGYLGNTLHTDIIVSNAWHVVSSGRPFFIDEQYGQECAMNDICLRPISGLPDADTTDELSPVKRPEPELA